MFVVPDRYAIHNEYDESAKENIVSGGTKLLEILGFCCCCCYCSVPSSFESIRHVHPPLLIYQRVEEADGELVRYLILRMTPVSGLIHSVDNCASSANRKTLRMSLEVSCILRLYTLRTFLTLSGMAETW
jgi:hypothetical protein